MSKIYCCRNFIEICNIWCFSGGASGIGLETSRVFALRGIHVIIAARNTEAASKAMKTIMENNPAARIDVLKLDLSSLKSVRAFADQFNSMKFPLNILM
jgi:retinol dehydrogenase 12